MLDTYLNAYDDFIQGKLQDHQLDEEQLKQSAAGVLTELGLVSFNSTRKPRHCWGFLVELNI